MNKTNITMIITIIMPIMIHRELDENIEFYSTVIVIVFEFTFVPDESFTDT